MEILAACVPAIGSVIVAAIGAVVALSDRKNETERARQRLFELTDKLIKVQSNETREVTAGKALAVADDKANRGGVVAERIAECIIGEIDKEIAALKAPRGNFLDRLDDEGVCLMFTGAAVLFSWGWAVSSVDDAGESLEVFCILMTVVCLILGPGFFVAGKLRDVLRRKRGSSVDNETSERNDVSRNGQ